LEARAFEESSIGQAFSGSSTNANFNANSDESNPMSEAMHEKYTTRPKVASRRRRVRCAGTTGAALGQSGANKENESAVPCQRVIITEADEIAEL
jgi:hypothetical protein